MGRRTGIVNMVAVALVLTSATVYALNVAVIPASVGFALVLSLSAVILATNDRLSPRVNLAAAAVIVTLGLGTVLVMGGSPLKAARVLRDFAWAQAALGVWMTYSALLTLSVTTRIDVSFDDASRARWREGDIAFGADLAGRVVVQAQPSWAALVVETAWPEPRPAVVDELVKTLVTARRAEVAALKERMHGKGGTSASDARWELARIACDVVIEVEGREGDDVGGAAVGRLIVHAAKAVRDDEDATRIFAALVLPAVARRL